MEQGVKDFTQGARPLLTVEIEKDFDALKGCWQAFQRTASGGPHDTWEWNQAWAKTAGKDTDARIAIGRDAGGQIVFILPLAIRRRRSCRVLEWFASDQGNYSSGLFDMAVWERAPLPRGKALLDHVLKALPKVDAVHLEKVPATREGHDSPFSGIAEIPEASPGHSFPVGDDWEAYYESQFSSKVRANLRRDERRLSDGDPATFEQIGDGKSKLAMVDAAAEQKSAFLVERGIRNFFQDDGVRMFLRRLAALPEDSGDLSARVYTCRKNGELLAAKMGVVHKGVFYGMVSSTTSSPIRRYSPGSVLFKHSVALMSGEGVKSLDCGAGEDETKLRWCTETHERLNLLHPVTAKGHAYTLSLRAALMGKLFIKNNPGLWDRYKRMRQWLACYLRPNNPECDEAATLNQQTSAAR